MLSLTLKSRSFSPGHSDRWASDSHLIGVHAVLDVLGCDRGGSMWFGEQMIKNEHNLLAVAVLMVSKDDSTCLPV